MKTTLGAYSNIRTGQTFKNSLQNRANGDIAVLQPRDIANGKIETAPIMINSDEVPVLDNHILKTGEVLIVNKGTKFSTLLYEEKLGKALATASFYVISPKPELLPSYLNWYLNQPPAREYFAQHAGGSTIPTITKSVLANLSIPVIPIQEQQFIAALLRESETELELLKKLARKKEEYYNSYIWEHIINGTHA